MLVWTQVDRRVRGDIGQTLFRMNKVRAVESQGGETRLVAVKVFAGGSVPASS